MAIVGQVPYRSNLIESLIFACRGETICELSAGTRVLREGEAPVPTLASAKGAVMKRSIKANEGPTPGAERSSRRSVMSSGR